MFLDSSHTFMFWSSLVSHLVKNRLQCGRPGFNPWVGKIPWRRECLPTPVFWPGEFHGLYSPRDGKDSDTTERLWLCFRIPRVVLVKSKLSGFFFFFYGIIFCCRDIAQFIYSSAIQSSICFTSFLFLFQTVWFWMSWHITSCTQKPVSKRWSSLAVIHFQNAETID